MSLDCKVDKERERIVFGRTIDWGEEGSGNMVCISPLGPKKSISVETARELLDKQYIDPNSAQNSMTTMKELIEYGEELVEDGYEVEYTGYMIGPDRPDARITLTAINVTPPENEEISRERERAFRNTFSSADDLEADENSMYAWWD